MTATAITEQEIADVHERGLQIITKHVMPAEKDGWEVVTKEGDPTKENDALWLWRKPMPSGAFEYCVFGGVPYSAATLQAVNNDFEAHKAWDSSAGEMYMKRKLDASSELCYWEVKYPWPMSSRDYAYVRRIETSRNEHGVRVVMYSRAAQDAELPEKSKLVRVVDYHSATVIEADSPSSCKFLYFMYEDPRGSIPKSVVNFFVSRSLPSFMKALHKACANYDKSHAQ
mmetsp:Transcript_8942/g.23426  ORF Transcript_8942/g.23426 Transcript_8942/m.23426 type:complete len:228 (-) Transcript_8942:74-757(-)